eukprot:CAMPEP_0168529820 /NCGR_PEP_ID=MMETSP0405-20121227/14188_1 /TAXON_ID=498012 /ORGANISM="Trichosphaerium sp, Strain Am-I-7 wt" /LENGTH=288 /DNA_ID=CAMNT_0008553721 /DNA_START=11 /DNA_END=873 /DNA_ORIENTATION=-
MGSLNTYHNSHPLRERARKIKQGIMVVRYEMPYNVWCTHCNEHIGKGVRYNAEKQCVGNYFTTKIWEFRMTCHLCQGKMVVRTDPQNYDYAFISGVRKKVETWEAGKETGTIKLMENELKEKIATDPFAKLENLKKDEIVAVQEAPEISLLYKIQTNKSENDWALSRQIRKGFRQNKKRAAKRVEEARSRGLAIPLLDASEEDSKMASRVSFKTGKANYKKQMKLTKYKLKSASIFGNPGARRTARRKLLTKALKQGMDQSVLVARRREENDRPRIQVVATSSKEDIS